MTRLSRSKRLACGIAAAGILSATVAFASEPSSGTIGSSAPKVEWSGELQGSGIYYQAWADDPTISCPGTPLCDPFALTVADGPHPVTIRLHILSTNVDGSDPGAGIRIGYPDGSYQYTQGNASEQTAMVLRLKSLPAGEYEVNVVASHVCCGTDPYTASAEVVGAAAPPSTPPSSTPPSSTPPPPATQLTVKAGKASAKKLNKKRKLTLTASTSAPLTNVVAKFLKGKKTVGSAKLAKMSGTAKLVLKLKRKLKKGRYTATVSGVDEQGRQVTTGIKVKVGR